MAEINEIPETSFSADEKSQKLYKTDPEAYVYEAHPSEKGEKGEKGSLGDSIDASSFDAEQGEITADIHLDTNLQLVTKTLDITDDPSISPYTFRSFFLGIGLACFGAVIAEIFYFKPQSINVNVIFLEIIAFVLGELTTLIPRWGKIGRFLNPGPFTQKEHVFITIFASSAATCALGTEQLAVQSLYYNETPNAASAIFMLLSSQMLGYGFLGGLRKLFVYPTKMLWPLQMPEASLFQSLHLNKAIAKKRLKVFWWVCGFVIIWEMVPEYIFPLTTGISIFCLAGQHIPAFTYLFGGANGDEGLGFLSWCMDWQYVGTDMFVLPLDTLINQFIGYIGCIALTTGVYWANLWNAKTFPFMAQDLFTADGDIYNQTLVLNDKNEVDEGLLAAYGLPWFATSNVLGMLCMNIAITAAIVHVLIWNWMDIREVFVWAHPTALKKWYAEAKTDGRLKFWQKSSYVEKFPGTEGDPHFAAMRAYKEAPSWWYTAILVIAFAIGMGLTYQQKTALPWCKLTMLKNFSES